MRSLIGPTLRRWAAGAAAAVLLSACNSATSPSTPSNQGSIQSIQHVVVIYQENWSFDGLYGSFPGANGLASAPSPLVQVDKVTGLPLTSLPQPLDSAGAPDPNFPAGLPVKPYDAMTYISPSTLTGDLVHRFWQEQSQIDGGKMDGFVSWSDNPGLTLSHFDIGSLPEAKLAAEFTLSDNTFHSAFGGSFLNHQWLICACSPTFPSPPSSYYPTLNSAGTALALDSSGNIVHDGKVTPDGFGVNTMFSVNHPQPSGITPGGLVPNQTNPTIGDELSAAGVSWKWYSGGWDDALANNPDANFQFHHQPFIYYANYADGTAAKAAHLQDETNFMSDISAGTLPSVSFVKPLGTYNEHPGYAALQAGQAHVAALIAAIQSSPYWASTAVVITYDENGGRWDHVAPPGPFDRWGPGTRVPLLVISPYAKHGYVDHTEYETVSILAFIEKRWRLKALGTRDAAANPLTSAFDFAHPIFAFKRVR